MNNKEDICYIKEVLKGNTAAFAPLVEKYKDMVFTLAYKITGNREDAEEVSQDAFLNVFKSLSEFRKTSCFSTWLYRIVYNQSISKTRKKKIETESLDQSEYTYEIYGEDDINLLNYSECIPSHLLKKAFDMLDETGFTILSLFYRESVPVKEISEITGLSVSNVKVKLFRSRKKLIGNIEKMLKTKVTDLI